MRKVEVLPHFGDAQSAALDSKIPENLWFSTYNLNFFILTVEDEKGITHQGHSKLLLRSLPPDSSSMPEPTYPGDRAIESLKTPPFSREAEQSVLGGLILNNEAWISIADRLIETDFYLPEHQILFRAIKSLSEDGHPYDAVLIAEWLQKENLLEAVGGGAYLGRLVNNTPSASNIVAYANVVRERAILRQLLRVGLKITDSVYDTQGRSANQLLNEAEGLVFEIAELGVRSEKGFVKVGNILTKTLDRIDVLSQQEGTVTGVATGFSDLDRQTSGFQKSDLIVVAGRPAMGKCITSDSQIVLADGSITTIKEIYQHKKAQLLTLGANHQFYLTQPIDFIDDGIKPVFRVTTQLGRTIETTKNHPFLTVQGWTPLSEISVGDKIAVPRKIAVFGQETLKESQIKLLAESINQWQLGDSPFIPSIIFKLQATQLALFLKHLLAPNARYYYSESQTLIKQIQHLLLRFGIIARISQEVTWQLELLDENIEEIYWDEIKTIEPVGLKQVYDLTIPETHNFVANDICVHNTSFAMNIAEHVAVKEKRPVAVFSMEMSDEQLVMRLISSLGKINLQNVRTGKLNDDDWRKMGDAISQLELAPLFIDETPALNPTELRARVRRLAREQGQLGLVVIDYLQLMQVPDNRESRANEVSEISRSLKSLAKELNVPVIALSQLNRSLEQRTDKRPKMSDLRESGCLAGDSLVTCAYTGAQVPIRDLIGRTNFYIWGLNTQTMRLEAAKISRAFCTGIKPVYHLTTRLRRTIRATGNHKFYTPKGWKRLDELTQDDYLALPRRIFENVAIFLRSQFAQSDIYWDRIVSIEPAGEEEVFDLTVPNLHNFVSNNIFCHNSIEQDSDLIIFIYRDIVYNEDSEDENAAEIIIAKQRNGPTGTIRLVFEGEFTKFQNYVHEDVYQGERGL